MTWLVAAYVVYFSIHNRKQTLSTNLLHKELHAIKGAQRQGEVVVDFYCADVGVDGFEDFLCFDQDVVAVFGGFEGKVKC